MKSFNVEEKLQKKNGLYFVDFTYRKKRVRYSGTKKKSVIMRAQAKMDEIDMFNDNPQRYRMQYSNKTFKEIYELYARTKNWSKSTRIKNDGIINNYFKQYLDIKISEFDKQLAEKLYVKIKGLNEIVCTDYVNKIIRLFVGILQYACENDYLVEKINTYNMVTLKAPGNKSKSAIDKKMDFEDFISFMEGANKLPDAIFTRISKTMFLFESLFLFATACRINEARAIKVSDFKYDSKNKIYYIEVSKQFLEDTNEIVYHLKNKDTFRKVPVKPEIFEQFKKWIEELGKKDDDYVFQLPNTKYPISRKSYTYLLQKIIAILKETGTIPEYVVDNFSPHGWRYSNTNYLLDVCNLPIEESAEIQGHSVAMMLNIYTRTSNKNYQNVFSVKSGDSDTSSKS